MLPSFLFLLGAGDAPSRTIVVNAPRTEQELADCLARSCSVREDAIASIRHAQAQFAQGTYPEARKTLLASLHRNRRATAEDPRALSALWHALARVTLHNGDMQEYRRASLRAGSILARSGSVTPLERIRGEVQMADAFASSGDAESAIRRYRRLGSDARARGDQELAEIMQLRGIYAGASFDGRPAARRALERAAQNETLTPRARTMALSLAAQLQDGRKLTAEALLEQVPVQGSDAPLTLIFKPTDKLTDQRQAINRALANNDSTLFNLLQPRSNEARRYRWADIGFRVRPDGRVSDVEVLRGSHDDGWTKDVVQSITGRRYVPFQLSDGQEAPYKIERVTLTYEHMTPAGSLIRRRSGLPSYRFEELKIEQAGGG